MCIRVYALTERNKLLCGALSVLTVAQFCFGIYFTVMNGTTPCEFPDRFFVRSRVVLYRPLVSPLPEINLDAYKSCLPPSWRPGELTFVSISVTFGTPLLSDFQHDFTSGVLTHRGHHRSFHVLDHLVHSQKVKDE